METQGEKLANILVVDDNPINLQVVGAVLEQAGYAAVFAFDGPTALGYIASSPPDLILLDLMMPGMDGYEVLATIKANPATRGIPVILLTAKVGPEETVRGFEAGAADYVAKPFDYRELLARISFQIELMHSRRRLEDYARQLEEMNDKLVGALGKLEELATTDLLTKLPNRRYVMDRLSHEVDRSNRSGKGFCMGILDIDHFKDVNDKYGHEAGDAVLAAFGQLVHDKLRHQDLAGRWGGEEFAIVLTETTLDGAVVLAERLLASLRELRVKPGTQASDALLPPPPEGIGIHATIGLAAWNRDISVDALIRRADEALYAGKTNGRDRVVAIPD